MSADEADARDSDGEPIEQLLSDVDAEDTKALRAWMLRVNNILHRKSLIDSEERQELHDQAMKATGWDDE